MKLFNSSGYTSVETPESVPVYDYNESPAIPCEIDVDDRLKPYMQFSSSQTRLEAEEHGHGEIGMFSNGDRNSTLDDVKESGKAALSKLERDSKYKALGSFMEPKTVGDRRRNSNQFESMRRGSGGTRRRSSTERMVASAKTLPPRVNSQDSAMRSGSRRPNALPPRAISHDTVIRSSSRRWQASVNSLPPKANSHSTVIRSSSRRQLLAKNASQRALLMGADKERANTSERNNASNQRSSRRIHRGRSTTSITTEDEAFRNSAHRQGATRESSHSRGHTTSVREQRSRSGRRSSAPEEINRVSVKNEKGPRKSKSSLERQSSRKLMTDKSLTSLQRRSCRNLMVDAQGQGHGTSRLSRRGSSRRELIKSSGVSQRLAETLSKSCSSLNNSCSKGVVLPMVTDGKARIIPPSSKGNSKLDDDVDSGTDLDFNDSANCDLLSIA